MRITVAYNLRTDDSFLNDVRVGVCSMQHTQRAIDNAKSGPVEQGSVGAGTGMTSFDFAGGIGTASRTLSMPEGHFTLGVLTLSNFGRMRNLTIEGRVVGRDLDGLYAKDQRRTASEGSVIVVIAARLRALQLPTLICQEGGYNLDVLGECVAAFLSGFMD